MKAILISIKPYWVEKILNKKKTIEIRKKFPKDYVGWVYIYCTLGELLQVHWKKANALEGKPPSYILYGRKVKKKDLSSPHTLNGKVVARFWCDNVTEYINGGQWHNDNTFGSYDDYIKDNILEKSCLAEEELFDYCEDLAFSVIHISQLEIFDNPKELHDFKILAKGNKHDHSIDVINYNGGIPLTKAPQSWCYVEKGWIE